MAQGQVVVKNNADTEPGIDIILGSTTPTVNPFRVLAADGKTVLFTVAGGGSISAQGFSLAVRSVTTNYTAVGGDAIILVNATGGAVTITLPAANQASPTGKFIQVVKIDSSANAVTIQRAGSDTIEGLTTINLQTQYSSVTLYSDGTGVWYPSPGAFSADNLSLKTVTTTYTITQSDDKVLANATGGAFTITLPAANSVPAGWEVRVEKIDAAANTVTVSRAGADTIEGANTVALAAQYSNTRLTSDGTSVWYKL